MKLALRQHQTVVFTVEFSYLADCHESDQMGQLRLSSKALLAETYTGLSVYLFLCTA